MYNERISHTPESTWEKEYNIWLNKCEGSDSTKCDKDYMGEMESNLKARFMEHRRPSSSTSEVSRNINKDKV